MSSYDSQNMPQNYDSGGGGNSSSGKTNSVFVKSIQGILRIVESVVALVAFICAAVGSQEAEDLLREDTTAAAGYCMFVSMTCCLLFIITYFLWLFKVFPHPTVPWKFTEFVIFVSSSLLFFIAGCVSAAKGHAHAGMAAASFFNFSMMVLCGVDSFFHYQYWRSSDEGPYICGQAAGGAGAGGSSSSSTPPTQQEPRGPTY